MKKSVFYDKNAETEFRQLDDDVQKKNKRRRDNILCLQKNVYNDMSKQLPKKIKKALAVGDLISHDQIMSNYSKEEREEILERARYLKAAMKLRQLRAQMRLSQQQLARKMRVKREYISLLESGRQNITLNTLYRIGESVGKEVEVLFK